MKITVVGSGYVGLSIAILLAQNNEVTILDVISEKIEILNNKKSPIIDDEISDFLQNKSLTYTATTDVHKAYTDAEFIIIATPTSYDVKTSSFNTESIEKVINEVTLINSEAYIIIKSTLPIGYTEYLKTKFNLDNIIFSPEFLREGRALKDNLYPSRIVVGDNSKKGMQFANLLTEGAIKKDIDILFTGSTEAEAIKLFSNSYLAMRVSFFNELDTFAEVNNLNSRQIIEGLCLDPRVGSYYNNPSFGYGGYCLPKDTKQLKNNFKNVPHSLVSAIVESNSIRKNFIAESIINKKPKIVGVYRLLMKSGSDNFRESSIKGIIKRLIKHDIKIVIYEPLLLDFKDDELNSLELIMNLKDFKNYSDLIIANRMHKDLLSIKEKVYTRDLFNSN